MEVPFFDIRTTSEQDRRWVETSKKALVAKVDRQNQVTILQEHEKGEEKGQFTSRPDQQDHQEEQDDNEIDGIELLCAATVSVTKLVIIQHSEQLKNNLVAP